MSLILGVDNLLRSHTWVDESFAVHMGSKGHKGGGMSLGHGFLLTKSTKQKLSKKQYRMQADQCK